jgi:hypothetical protein
VFALGAVFLPAVVLKPVIIDKIINILMAVKQDSVAHLRVFLVLSI